MTNKRKCCKCFQKFDKQEMIEGRNGRKCESCYKKVSAGEVLTEIILLVFVFLVIVLLIKELVDEK